MKRDIPVFKNNYFDLLVIGGGINGCAIARDAALRGAKTALVEKDDFAAGASGKTTKLIHGGIRYLEQLNFKLVFEALRERGILLRIAPELVKPLEFVIPVFKGGPRSLFKMKLGVFIYDFLAGRANIKHHQVICSEKFNLLKENIGAKNLLGALIYYDAQVDDARLCIENAISAYGAGACLANKVEVLTFIKAQGKIIGVEARDNLSGERFTINASVVINATGPWANLLVKDDDPNSLNIVRPTKGVHLVYKKLPHDRAILFSARKDKRIIFIIPWRGCSLIGTTDTDYSGSYDQVYASLDDVEYLLAETRNIFPDEIINKEGVLATFAGLRPLLNNQGKPSWQVSREHCIKESPSGLISVAGGKYTTYRLLAERVVDLALSKFRGRAFSECVTKTAALPPSFSKFTRSDLRQQVEFAVKEEMANTLVGLLTRRLGFTVIPSLGLEHAKECADIMAELLGWSNEQRESQLSMYGQEVDRNSVERRA